MILNSNVLRARVKDRILSSAQSRRRTGNARIRSIRSPRTDIHSNADDAEPSEYPLVRIGRVMRLVDIQRVRRRRRWSERRFEDLKCSVCEHCPFVSGSARCSKSFHPRSKHIAIQYHFTRELVQNNQVTVRYIPTKAMVADALTKALPKPQYIMLTEMMGVSARI